MNKTEARRLRSELQTLTQASFTVSTFLHIKQGFVASHQKTNEGAGGGTPSTTTSPPNPPALQICKCVAEQKERVYGKADFHGVRSVPHAGSSFWCLCTVIGLLNISQLLCLLSRGAGYTQWHCYLDYIAS